MGDMVMDKPNNTKIERLNEKLTAYFSKLDQKLKDQPGLQVLVRSDKLGVDYQYPSNQVSRPYHLASIGKVFTATLAFQLIERGKSSAEEKVSKLLPPEQLDRLFVFEGVDYQDQITVKHLIGHMSGVADYFDDPVTSGLHFSKEVIDNPKTRWTPTMLLDFSRLKQKAVGKPGAVYHYSDTGYVLLGLVIEAITGKPFHKSMEDEFFVPLGMNDTYLMFYGEPVHQPQKPLEKLWLNGTEVSTFTSVSCDWAGGGIVSTLTDLLKFQQALRQGKLIKPSTLKEMTKCPNKFQPGIYYGLGMMEIHFEDFFFLLKGFPRVTGHIGVLATHMFYDEQTQTHIIMNFGNTAHMTASFKALIEILKNLKGIAV
jgi:D-alanyl-D-alanine carboxypeptidase